MPDTHTLPLLEALQGFAAPQPAPKRVTGNFLAKSNGKSRETRVAIALRMVAGEFPVERLTISQICRLCRVPRARVDRQLGRHTDIAAALAKAFRRASPEQRAAFMRAVGSEEIWSAFQAAL